MGTPRARLIDVFLVLGLGACAAWAVHLSGIEGQWEHMDLFVLLMGFALVSDLLMLQFGTVRLSGSFIALIMAMALLGPVPAMCIAITTVLWDSLRAHASTRLILSNSFAYACFPLVGGAAYATLEPSLANASELAVAATIVPFFLVVNALNFLLIFGYGALAERASLIDGIRHAFIPVLPSQIAAAALTASVTYLYLTLGTASVVLLTVVVLVFTYLLRTNLASQEYARELEIRTQELAGLQVGLITTVLRTLAMRDKMTARHSAAVARYSREMARRMALPERDQELIHTAGLFHDVGKFIFPDSILLADRRLSDEDYETVKQHPQQGADLIRRIGTSYDEVADIVLAHHERWDGGGYPQGLAGEDIPIGARILAVADTYDVMTARDSYQVPVSSEDAIAELRRVAGSQLDALVVEHFIELVRDGGLRFRHADDADFEAELAFDDRVRDLARPLPLPLAV